MIQNIGKLFYKDYYKDINFEYVLDRTKEGSQDGNIARMNDKIKKSGFIPLYIIGIRKQGAKHKKEY